MLGQSLFFPDGAKQLLETRLPPRESHRLPSSDRFGPVAISGQKGSGHFTTGIGQTVGWAWSQNDRAEMQDAFSACILDLPNKMNTHALAGAIYNALLFLSFKMKASYNSGSTLVGNVTYQVDRHHMMLITFNIGDSYCLYTCHQDGETHYSTEALSTLHKPGIDSEIQYYHGRGEKVTFAIDDEARICGCSVSRALGHHSDIIDANPEIIMTKINIGDPSSQYLILCSDGNIMPYRAQGLTVQTAHQAELSLQNSAKVLRNRAYTYAHHDNILCAVADPRVHGACFILGDGHGSDGYTVSSQAVTELPGLIEFFANHAMLTTASTEIKLNQYYARLYCIPEDIMAKLYLNHKDQRSQKKEAETHLPEEKVEPRYSISDEEFASWWITASAQIQLLLPLLQYAHRKQWFDLTNLLEHLTQADAKEQPSPRQSFALLQTKAQEALTKNALPRYQMGLSADAEAFEARYQRVIILSIVEAMTVNCDFIGMPIYHEMLQMAYDITSPTHLCGFFKRVPVTPLTNDTERTLVELALAQDATPEEEQQEEEQQGDGIREDNIGDEPDPHKSPACR